ncbi:MAG: hypothetical protein JKX72_02690 [Robiginitomaculum sp.]|nr:hypothetical protein [Robiginitomaculum sp.]
MSVKRTPLLPNEKTKDNPLFIVLAILGFLATLSLLSFKASYLAVDTWRAELHGSASIHIKTIAETESDHLKRALDILKNAPEIASMNIMSKQQSKALLRPWLGDIDLPTGFPMPILLDVQLKPNTVLSENVLQQKFSSAGIKVDINSHNQWATSLGAKAQAVQVLSLLALLLIGVAILSACIFAVRAGIIARRKLMDILQQIGAAPQFTARIFSTKFALTSLKAGLVGAGGGLILVYVLSLVFRVNGGTLLPRFHIGIHDIYLAGLIPIFMGLISGLTAWQTIVKTLNKEIYT